MAAHRRRSPSTTLPASDRPRPSGRPKRRVRLNPAFDRMEDRLLLATRTWVGGVSELWSEKRNWAENKTPVAGDDLVFAPGASRLTLLNDLSAGTAFRSLSFTGSGYSIGGNSVTLTAGLSYSVGATTAASNSLSMPLNLQGSSSITVANTTASSATVTLLLGAPLSDAAMEGLTKLGNGTLALGGSNTFDGPATVSAGTLLVTNAGALGTTAAGTTVAAGATLQLQGNLVVAETFTLGGTLGNVSGTSILSGPVNVPAAATVNLTAGQLTLSGVVSGAGSIAKSGTGVLVLTGANTYAGGTSLTAGQINVGSDQALGTGALSASASTTLTASGARALGNAASLTGTLTVNTPAAADALSLSGTIGGAGGLTKTGAGDLTLSGPNTFSGGLSLNAGTLGLGSNAALGSPLGTFTVAGGTVRAVGADRTLGNSVVVSTNMTVAAGFDLRFTGGNNRLAGASGNRTFAVNNANLLFASGFAEIGPSGKSITKTGSGTLALGGASTYLNGTTLAGGTLAVGHNLALGSGTLTAFPNTTLRADGGARSLTVPIAVTGIVNINSNSVLEDLTLSGVVSGSGGLFKSGPADLTLSGSNSYTGTTTVGSGVLVVQNASALGSAAAGTSVSQGATLRLAPSVGVTSESLSVSGASGSGGVELLAGSASWGGPVSLTGLVTVNVAGSGSLLVSGAVGGSGGFEKAGAGTLTFAGTSANSFAGGAGVVAGTLVLSKSANVVAVPGPLSIGDDLGGSGADVVRLTTDSQVAGNVTVLSSGRLDLNNRSDAIGTLTLQSGLVTTGTGAITLGGDLTSTGSSQITGTLDLGTAPRTFTITGPGLDVPAVVSGSSAATLTKTGFGTLVLAAANTYAGETVLDQGYLQMAHTSALGSTLAGTKVARGGLLVVVPGLVVDGESLTLGTASTTGSIFPGGVLASGTGFTWNGPVTLAGRGGFDLGNSKVTLAGTVGGSGEFSISGGGELVLASANTYTGTTVVSGTILTVKDNAALGSATGGTELREGATLRIDGSLTLAEPLSLAGPVNVTDAGGVSTLSGAIVLNDVSGSPTFNVAGTLTASGVVSGAAGLTKAGVGTLALSGANTYGGATVVAAGVLDAQSAIALGSTASGTTILDGGSLDVSATASVAEALTVRGQGYQLSGVVRGEPCASLTGPVTLAGDSRFVVGSAGSFTIAGAVGDGGAGYALEVDTAVNSATLVLSGSNTYTGSTRLAGSGVTLKLGASGVIPDTSSVSIASGATLDLNGFDEGMGALSGNGSLTLGGGALTVGLNGDSDVFHGVISGTGSVIKAGTGEQRLGGFNTYEGPTTISQGNVRLQNSHVLPDNTTVTVASGTTLDFWGFSDEIGSLGGSGTVHLRTGTITVGGNHSTAFFDGLLDGEGTLVKTGTGYLFLLADSPRTGPTTVSDGTLYVQGSQPSSDVTVEAGAFLAGNGTVGAVTVLPGGHLSPESGPSVLTTAGLDLRPDSYLHAEFYGTTPGGSSGYDQLRVNGPVSLGGWLVPSFDLTSAVGDQLTLIANLGGDAVAGTFFNSAEGNTYTAPNGVTYVISYAGGSGGDVVLTHRNFVPTFQDEALTLTPGVLPEGQQVTLSGAFRDADPLDTHTVVIDWGDGQTTTLNLAAGVETFSDVTHTYDDDPAGGDDTYTVTVTVTDPHDGSAESQTTTTVANLPPSSGTLVAPATALEGSSVPVSVTGITDPSSADQSAGFTYSFDFDNDGTFEVVDSTSPSAVVPASLLPDGPATLVVRARVTDKDGGSLDLTATVAVLNTGPIVVGPVRMGALDLGFGDGGVSVTDFAFGEGPTSEYGSGVTVLPDGKVLAVAGVYWDGGHTIALARYLADGTLDPAFGDGGKARLETGFVVSAAMGLVVQSDGRIVVGGQMYDPATQNFDLVMARFLADGSRDLDFGVDGLARLDVLGSGTHDYASALTAQADGKILFVGLSSDNATVNVGTVARFQSDGTLDPTFGSGGVVILDLAEYGTAANGVTVAPDGRIFVVGQASTVDDNVLRSVATLVCLEPDGTFDAAFGQDGIVLGSFVQERNDYAFSAVVQPDGKIVVAGQTQDTSTGRYDSVLWRFHADGTSDTSFGEGGTARVDFGGSDYIWSIALRPDGMIYAEVSTTSVTGYDILVARFSPDGSLDPAFGSGGIVRIDRSPMDDGYGGIVLGADGSVIVAGQVNGDLGVVRLLGDDTPAVVPAVPEGGATPTLHGYFADPGADTWTATVDYGDGGGAQPLTLSPGKTFVLPPHAYAQDGAYTVTLTVTDDDGGTGSTSFVVYVNNVAPTVVGLTRPGEPIGPFGGGGVTTVNTAGPSFEQGQASALTADGRVVVAGIVRSVGRDLVGVSRFTATGAPDTSFNGTGWATFGFDDQTQGSDYIQVNKVFATADGKILIAGRYSTQNYNEASVFVARLNPDGTLDQGFGEGGRVAVDLSSANSSDQVGGLAVDGLGRVVVAAFAVQNGDGYQGADLHLLRFLDDGQADPGFGVDGHVIAVRPGRSEWPAGLKILEDGTILVGGETDHINNNTDRRLFLARFDDSGSPEAGYGTDGFATSSSPLGANEYVFAMAVQDDGRVVFGGTTQGSLYYDFLLVRLNDDASLDAGFGTGGRVKTDMFGWERVNDLAVLPDGRILAAGRQDGQNYPIVAARYTTSGALDPSFGSGGRVNLTAGTYFDTTGVVLGGDGSFFVTGSVADRNTTPNDPLDFAAVKFVAGGAADAAYGLNGLARLNTAGSRNDVLVYQAAALAPDGSSVAIVTSSGFNGLGQADVLVRVLPDGTLDPSFGEGGRIEFPRLETGNWINLSAVVILPDGKILVAGYSNNSYNGSYTGGAPLLAQFNPDGTPDAAFGGGTGRVLEYGTTNVGAISALVVLPDGKILAARSAYTPSGGGDFQVVRFRQDGSIDTSFGTGGSTTFGYTPAGAYDPNIGGPLPPSDDNPTTLVVAPDGSILVAGTTYAYDSYDWDYGYISSRDADFALARLTPDGQLDGAFGTGGKVFNDFNLAADYLRGIAFGADGTITAFGGSTVARYLPNGALDTTFGGDGWVTAPAGSLVGGLILPDDRVLAVGQTAQSPNYDIAIVALNPDGSLDTTFGAAGVKAFDVDGYSDSPLALRVGADGSFAVYTYSMTQFGGSDLGILRFHSSDAAEAPPLVEGDALTGMGHFIDPGTDSWTATVDYGDGTGPQVLALNTNKTFSLNHTYADNGTYYVTIVVDDGNGGVTTSQLVVNVSNASPVLTLAGDQAVEPGQLLVLPVLGTVTDQGFASPDGVSDEVLTYTINWGDGTDPDTGLVTVTQAGSPGVLTAGTISGSHVYAAEGVYVVEVYAYDDDGAFDVRYSLVFVSPAGGTFSSAMSFVGTPDAAPTGRSDKSEFLAAVETAWAATEGETRNLFLTAFDAPAVPDPVDSAAPPVIRVDAPPANLVPVDMGAEAGLVLMPSGTLDVLDRAIAEDPLATNGASLPADPLDCLGARWFRRRTSLTGQAAPNRATCWRLS